MSTGTLQSHDRSNLADCLREFHTEAGRSLLDLVDESPVLLVFLRHFSCAFCAMALDRVSHVRPQIEAKGVRPVFVHLGSPQRAKPYFDYYHLSDVERISNPEATLYQVPTFGLSRTNPYLHSLRPAVLKGMVELIHEIVETHGEATIGKLGAIINVRDPIFSPKRYGSASLSALLKQLSGFTLTPVKGEDGSVQDYEVFVNEH